MTTIDTKIIPLPSVITDKDQEVVKRHIESLQPIPQNIGDFYFDRRFSSLLHHNDYGDMKDVCNLLHLAMQRGYDLSYVKENYSHVMIRHRYYI